MHRFSFDLLSGISVAIEFTRRISRNFRLTGSLFGNSLFSGFSETFSGTLRTFVPVYYSFGIRKLPSRGCPERFLFHQKFPFNFPELPEKMKTSRASPKISWILFHLIFITEFPQLSLSEFSNFRNSGNFPPNISSQPPAHECDDSHHISFDEKHDISFHCEDNAACHCSRNFFAFDAEVGTSEESREGITYVIVFPRSPSPGRSLQQPDIPITAFSQTDLFLVWIYLEFRSPQATWTPVTNCNQKHGPMLTCRHDVDVFTWGRIVLSLLKCAHVD